MLDYGTETDGVALAGVAEGSPAAFAGLRQGDVIISLAYKKILNIEDLTATPKSKSRAMRSRSSSCGSANRCL